MPDATSAVRHGRRRRPPWAAPATFGERGVRPVMRDRGVRGGRATGRSSSGRNDTVARPGARCVRGRERPSAAPPAARRVASRAGTARSRGRAPRRSRRRPGRVRGPAPAAPTRPRCPRRRPSWPTSRRRSAAGSTHSFVRGIGDRVRFDRPQPRPGPTTSATPPPRRRSRRTCGPWPSTTVSTRPGATGSPPGCSPTPPVTRRSVPAGRRVGDKTGTGSQGERNDTGVLFPPGRAPIVLAVHTAPDDPTPSRRTPPSRRPRGSSPPHPPRRRSSGGQEIRRT